MLFNVAGNTLLIFLATSAFISLYLRNRQNNAVYQEIPMVNSTATTVSGHGGSFTRGFNEMTRYKGTNQNEADYYKNLMQDINLKPFIPKYYGSMDENGNLKIELEEITYGFGYPIFIMDCKLGNRTYNPSEAGLDNHRPDALTKLQKHLPHLMKPEYYQNFSKKMLADIRGTVSSEQMLHFRIDGIGKVISKNTQPIMLLNETILWQTKYPPQLELALAIFTENKSKVIYDFVMRLEQILNALKQSDFLKANTLVGCSLLFVHDGRKTDVRLIDFAKAFRSQTDDIHTIDGIVNIARLLKDLAKRQGSWLGIGF